MHLFWSLSRFITSLLIYFWQVLHEISPLSRFIASLLIYFWQVLGQISPFLILIATVAAAIAAIWAFKVSRRILYYQLLARYSSPEMGKALDIMGELSRVRDEDSKKIEFFKILKQYRVCREGLKPTYTPIDSHIHKENGQIIIFRYEYQEINQARRQVSHFFITAFEMFSEMKVLDRYSFKKICTIDSIRLLYHVVEWFEIAQATSWEFDPKDRFTKLLYQSGRTPNEIEELEKLRPPKPKTWAEIEQMIQQPKQE